ncbi:PHD finger protein ING2 [Pseudocercospora fuligena]|uniref:PHD finger protein ING2 n=1 Tax=Pseudocercospora fuligena TaxID=685502 RepID=A0A8H6RB28_9PEZI|nr:PHD finger protein ING2 [Pseudocercospora fuligena]
MDSLSVEVLCDTHAGSGFPDPVDTTPTARSEYFQTPLDSKAHFAVRVLCSHPADIGRDALLIQVSRGEQVTAERFASIDSPRPLDITMGNLVVPAGLETPSNLRDPPDSKFDLLRDLEVRISQMRRTQEQSAWYEPLEDGSKPPFLALIDDKESKQPASKTFILKFRTISELRAMGLQVTPPDHVVYKAADYKSWQKGGLYCRCKKLIMGGAITCDNERCEVGTWHRWCVGLQTEKEGQVEMLDDVGNLWLCPECRVLRRDEIDIAGEDTDEKAARTEQKCFCPVGEAL